MQDALFIIVFRDCLLGSLLVVSLEVLEVLNLEGLDVSSLTKDILFGHANVYVSTLLEELRCLGCVAQDEQAHYQLGGHVVETASKEILSVLILQSLNIVKSLLVNRDELLYACLQVLQAVANLETCQHILDIVEHGAVGDVTDSSNNLQLSGTLVDREDTCVAEQTLALVLHDET